MKKPPKFHPKALPTSEGWISRKSKELLKREEHTDDELDEFKKAHSGEYKLINREYVNLKDLKAEAELIEEVEEIPSIEPEFSKPVNKMNKKDLKEYAWEHNIETRYLNKKQILPALKEADLS